MSKFKRDPGDGTEALHWHSGLHKEAGPLVLLGKGGGRLVAKLGHQGLPNVSKKSPNPGDLKAGHRYHGHSHWVSVRGQGHIRGMSKMVEEGSRADADPLTRAEHRGHPGAHQVSPAIAHRPDQQEKGDARLAPGQVYSPEALPAIGLAGGRPDGHLQLLPGRDVLLRPRGRVWMPSQ